jgi:hypothetical protein
MKKELSELLLIAVKGRLASMFVDFYAEMRNDLNLLEADYQHHFKTLGEILYKIDTCESIIRLEWLHSKGEIDLAGESFSDFVYDTLISLEKNSE